MNKEQTQSATEYTLGGVKANILAILLILPIGLLLAWTYWLVWPEYVTVRSVLGPIHDHPYTTIGVLIAGMIVHELIHGIIFSFFTDEGLRSVEFGFQWRAFAPYCHCREALRVESYKIALIMPGLLLGLLPTIIGLGTGSVMAFAYGLVFILAAGGDLLMILMLSNVSARSLVRDHPHKIGCLVYRRQVST